MKDLSHEVEQFAAQLKFSEEHRQNAPGFRKQVVSTLSASLSPGPGRPPEPNVTLAENLRHQGKLWPEVYPLCVDNYASLNRDSQRVAADNLRSAMHARRNARRRRVD